MAACGLGLGRREALQGRISWRRWVGERKIGGAAAPGGSEGRRWQPPVRARGRRPAGIDRERVVGGPADGDLVARPRHASLRGRARGSARRRSPGSHPRGRCTWVLTPVYSVSRDDARSRLSVGRRVHAQLDRGTSRGARPRRPRALPTRRPADAAPTHPDPVGPGRSRRPRPPRSREQVAGAQEAGHEAGARALVELLRLVQLLVRPRFMTAIRSDIVIASSWSWVT